MKRFFILCSVCAVSFLGFNACDEDSNTSPATKSDDGHTNPPVECPNACKGDDVCEGSGAYRTCKDEDGDGCKEWVTVSCDEGQKCDDGACVTADSSCQNTCEGDNDCDGDNAFKTCRDDNDDGCNEWVTVPCEENTKCDNGTCVPVCQNTCDGEDVCDGESAYKTCKDDDSYGCKAWVTVPCDEGKICKEGQCIDKCTSLCEKDQKQCNDKSVQTCDDYNGDGCFEWGGDSLCDYQCSDGGCIEDPYAWVPACEGDGCPDPVLDLSQKVSGKKSYVFKADEPGTIIAGSSSKDDTVSILADLNGSSLASGKIGASVHVGAGIYYVKVDTSSSEVKITFLPDSGKCGLKETVINRYNTPSTLNLPVTGKVVQEAHMFTDWDWEKHKRWPSTIKEFLDEHKAHSAEWTGISYGNEWCPSGEGGCEYGQGATSKPVPWKAEAWYICMYWKNKPTPGTRFIVVNPQTGEAVVTAAGYESGPGDGGAIGGAVYEVHQKLGTSHRSTLTFGEMIDQSLDYGPIDCN